MMTVESVPQMAAELCLAAATLGCVYLLAAAFLTSRYRRGESAQLLTPVPVTVLVPLCGDEPALADRLRILCSQDYTAPLQIICGVRSPSDPAIDIVAKVAAEQHAHVLECHVDPRVHGRNLKVSNVMNMVEQARHDTFLMIDSDVEVRDDVVRIMVGALQQPGVGAAYCLYKGVPHGGFWARLAASFINAHFLPNAVFALSGRLAQPCFGACLAMTRATLQRIGGLAPFTEQIWEDYAIGEAVRALGQQVVVAPFTVGHVYADNSAAVFFTGQLRSARTIRMLDPYGYAGSIVTHPLAFALIGALLGASEQAIPLALSALACRSLVYWCSERRFGNGGGSYIMLPLLDLIAFAVYVVSYFGATVVWRGQRYRLIGRTLVVDPS